MCIISVGVLSLTGCIQPPPAYNVETQPDVTSVNNAGTDTLHDSPPIPVVRDPSGDIDTDPTDTDPTEVYVQAHAGRSPSVGVSSVAVQPPTDDAEGYVDVTYTDEEQVKQTERYNFPITGQRLVLEGDPTQTTLNGEVAGWPESRTYFVHAPNIEGLGSGLNNDLHSYWTLNNAIIQIVFGGSMFVAGIFATKWFLRLSGPSQQG